MLKKLQQAYDFYMSQQLTGKLVLPLSILVIAYFTIALPVVGVLFQSQLMNYQPAFWALMGPLIGFSVLVAAVVLLSDQINSLASKKELKMADFVEVEGENNQNKTEPSLQQSQNSNGYPPVFRELPKQPEGNSSNTPSLGSKD